MRAGKDVLELHKGALASYRLRIRSVSCTCERNVVHALHGHVRSLCEDRCPAKPSRITHGDAVRHRGRHWRPCGRLNGRRLKRETERNCQIAWPLISSRLQQVLRFIDTTDREPEK